MKVAVTIHGCIDIPDEIWGGKDGDPSSVDVANFRYNDQLTENDTIDELASKLKQYPDDLEVNVHETYTRR